MFAVLKYGHNRGLPFFQVDFLSDSKSKAIEYLNKRKQEAKDNLEERKKQDEWYDFWEEFLDIMAKDYIEETDTKLVISTIDSEYELIYEYIEKEVD